MLLLMFSQGKSYGNKN